MKERTCCFTGHREISGQIGIYMPRLDDEVERLIGLGVTTFIAGGARGFDQMAASLIVAKRDAGHPVHLVLALPFRVQLQPEGWTSLDWRRHQRLLAAADVVTYVSENDSEDCMRARNCFMVDQSAYCVCALVHEKSGTGRVVRYAQQKGLCIINIAAHVSTDNAALGDSVCCE